MIERKVQTYTTNESGQKIVTYQGQGLGERKLVIQKNGRTVSEPSSVWDTLKYDNATQSSHNDAMWSSVAQFTRGTENTVFTNSAISTAYTDISGDICIELDISANTNYSSGGFLSIRQDNTVLLQATRDNLQLSNMVEVHIKIEIENNQCTITNTTNNQSVTGDVTNFNRFYLRIGANETIQFKNLKIYSI